MIRGFALVLTGGFLVLVEDPGFQTLGSGDLFGLKYPVYFFLGFALVSGFLLTQTTFGRYIYAVGGEPRRGPPLRRARESRAHGHVRALRASAGLAGIIVSSRISTGQADAGIGIEFTAIAAIVIGGTSIYGGEGAIWRTVLGVLFLAMIGNGFNLLNINPIYQQIIQGAVSWPLSGWMRGHAAADGSRSGSRSTPGVTEPGRAAPG